MELIRQLKNSGKTDLRIRTLALNTVYNCQGHDTTCEIRSIHDWIRLNITYRSDPYGVQALQEAWVTLELRQGNCAQFSILEGAMLETIGIPTKFKVIKTGSSQDHIYILAFDGSQWIPLDASEGYDIGKEYPNPRASYILG